VPRSHAYPPDLAHYVEANWPPGQQLQLPTELLEEALATAYQASMTAEETRPTRFRLLLTSPDHLPEDGRPNQGVLRLLLGEARPLGVDELRRLAPAVPFETALIGVHAVEGKLRIWGIAHSGPAWLAPSWGGRSAVPNWTYDPIIHVTAPGKIAVRSAGKLIAAIERGILVDAALDVFDSAWLPAMFEREREDVRAEHDARQAGTASPTSAEHSLVGKVAQNMLRRAIQLIRGARHGGLILVVDAQPEGSPRLGAALRLKYTLDRGEPSQRYRSLLLRILSAVAATTSKPSVGWADFASSEHPLFAELEQEVFEQSRVMSNLAGIDGALVLDKRFDILGFGAEVSAELPTPQRVWRALDTEGVELQAEDVQNVGTRHRAAYRFVNDHPQGLAVVISQDGGVSFVANRDGKVVFWEQSVSP
jgi:hypothetical protein